MKKLLLFPIILISFTALGQLDNQATATVNAKLVQAITVASSGNSLDFGSMTVSGGGKVRVSNDGQRTFSNPSMKLVSATTPPQAASFLINAANSYAYNIYIPSIELTDGAGAVMPVEFTQAVDGTTTSGTATGTGAEQTLTVGGLLTVGSTQATGAYSGTVKVTVAYQ